MANAVSEFTRDENGKITGFKSKYIEVPYIESDNNELAPKAYYIAFAMSLYDILRTDDEYLKMFKAFDDAMLVCKSDEDFEKIDNYLKLVAAQGEVGMQFYNGVKDKINNNGVELAKKSKQKFMEPVSKLYKNEAGSTILETKYYEVKYRPSNFALSVKCGTFLTDVAIYDALRSDDILPDVEDAFIDMLSECKNQKDLDEVLVFLVDTAEIGYCGKLFLEKYRDKVTMDYYNKHKVRNNKNTNNNSNSYNNKYVVDFKEKYKKLLNSFKHFLELKSFDHDEFEAYALQFDNIHKELESLYKYMSKEDFDLLDNDIEKNRNYIYSVLEKLESVNHMTRF